MRTVFTTEELCERLGLSRSAIRTMETDGKLHRLVNMPGVRYRHSAVGKGVRTCILMKRNCISCVQGGK